MLKPFRNVRVQAILRKPVQKNQMDEIPVTESVCESCWQRHATPHFVQDPAPAPVKAEVHHAAEHQDLDPAGQRHLH
jgi:hypothetical protein